jgi:acetolactate synthase-1/3 small subunit
MAQHTLSLLVENQHGALARIAGLFASRGYNITSLNVAETEDPSVSGMTIVVTGDDAIIDQVVKQLNRLIDVIKVVDFRTKAVVDRELVMVKVSAQRGNRHEIVELADIFGAKTAAVAAQSITLEITATTDMIDDFVALLKPYGIKEIVRTGKTALVKDSSAR